MLGPDEVALPVALALAKAVARIGSVVTQRRRRRRILWEAL